MSPNDRAPDVDPEHLDGLTPDQLRRFQVWRAMAGLARARAGGKLTAEQVQLLESLAESLQRLAGRLSILAELGQQCVELLDAGRASPGLVPGPVADPIRDSASGMTREPREP
jgi:hypothetical protein